MVHHVYGTSAAICGLVSAGVAPTDPSVTRAVEWLEAHQNADGGWGEDLSSLTQPDRIGQGTTTPSQTAWALLGLLAAGGHQRASTCRGVDWLLTRQRADGTWEERAAVGVIGGGKIGYIPLRYDLSRMIWPTMALGRYQQSRTVVLTTDRRGQHRVVVPPKS
jgi:squalene-hopene/tetraprenyl-beta-curcumene cyclase